MRTAFCTLAHSICPRAEECGCCVDPGTGDRVEVTAPLPADLAEFLNAH